MLKRYITKYVFFITGMAIICLACEKKLNEINTNKNNPTEVNVNLLLTESCVNTAFSVSGTDLAFYSSVFIEHSTGVHSQMESADKRTNITSNLANNAWNNLYHNMKGLKNIIDYGSEGGIEEGNWKGVGMAKVLLAYNLSIATDLWGSVPASEALFGNEIREPGFDSQQEVYETIFKLLNEAIVDLNKESVDAISTSDFFLGLLCSLSASGCTSHVFTELPY
jgi:hypothetical protein